VLCPFLDELATCELPFRRLARRPTCAHLQSGRMAVGMRGCSGAQAPDTTETMSTPAAACRMYVMGLFDLTCRRESTDRAARNLIVARANSAESRSSCSADHVFVSLVETPGRGPSAMEFISRLYTLSYVLEPRSSYRCVPSVAGCQSKMRARLPPMRSDFSDSLSSVVRRSHSTAADLVWSGAHCV
jgi:hypothetical protein